MKKIILLTISLLILSSLSLTTTYAADGPPTLDLTGLLGSGSSDNADDDSLDESEEEVEEDEDNTPPSLQIDLSGNETPIEITRVSASPNLFNPLVQELTIKYTLSANAKIDVEIQNLTGQRVAMLINNQSLGAGEHTAKWKGTVNNQITGDIVEPGRYKYKITVKDPNSGETVATRDAIITVQYAASQGDPADLSGQGQANAIVALQNTNSGRTAETGPGVLLYGLFPLAGYVVRKKFYGKNS